MRVVDPGRLPPQAPDMEQAVLGACLIAPNVIGKVSGILQPSHFYVPANATLWEIMVQMHRDGDAIDLIAVTDRVSALGKTEAVGGPFYISQLTNKVASSANVEYHARIIQQKYIQRQMIALGERLRTLDESEDVFDALDEANAMMAELNAIPSTKDPVSVAEVLDQIADGREKQVFVTLGMGQLDDHVRMGPADVTVIGARPSVGKTTFALNACMHMARAGHRVLFVSLEMNERALGAKISSVLTGIDSERITLNDIDEHDRERIAMANAQSAAWTSRILIEDLASLKASQIAGIIHRAVERHGVEVVVIDYLQCIQGEGDTPVDRMTNISRACKSAAKSSGVRLIELSQLKRRDGADADPQMSDLREAGQIEADGDIILMLGRKKGEQELLVKIEKNKVGPIGAVTMPFDLRTQRIGGVWSPATAPVSPLPVPRTTAPEQFHADNPF